VVVAYGSRGMDLATHTHTPEVMTRSSVVMTRLSGVVMSRLSRFRFSSIVMTRLSRIGFSSIVMTRLSGLWLN